MADGPRSSEDANRSRRPAPTAALIRIVLGIIDFVLAVVVVVYRPEENTSWLIAACLVLLGIFYVARGAMGLRGVDGQ